MQKVKTALGTASAQRCHLWWADGCQPSCQGMLQLRTLPASTQHNVSAAPTGCPNLLLHTKSNRKIFDLTGPTNGAFVEKRYFQHMIAICLLLAAIVGSCNWARGFDTYSK